MMSELSESRVRGGHGNVVTELTVRFIPAPVAGG